ncbi:MAG: DUF4287 domain-containing protein [Xanthomonadales bacterium]|nr:DUF4287 domain-containing protein [Xanthomonadales bacterium]
MSSKDPQIVTMEANILEKTGKPVPHWVQVVKKSGLSKHGQIVKFLKENHDFTHGYANLVAHKALASSADQIDDDELVAAQYAGPKAELRPIYDHVIKAVEGFGKDVELAPKKAYVSLRRKKQFALIQPSTKTRVDLGVNIKGKAPEGRLEASGSFNAMVSHRVRLESVSDFDAEVMGWLKEAYEAAG